MMNPTRPFGFSTVARAARAALQWRLLLLWSAVLLLPTALLALPVWQLLGANLDHSVHAAALARELDLSALADLIASASRGAPLLTDLALVALGVTLLLSPLLSGMVVSAARAPQVLGFRGLVGGALAEYPRMLRMLLVALVPFGLAAALGSAAMDAAGDYAGHAVLESDAELAGYAALLVSGLLFVLAHASVDAGRAALATDRRRRSALVAWWGGCKMLLRRPLATLGAYLGISVAGLLGAALLGLARIEVPPLGAAGIVGAVLLTELVVMTLAWMRGARLFALIDLAHAARA
jgi:hypothetical protein